jgi:hypothetical protein
VAFEEGLMRRRHIWILDVLLCFRILLTWVAALGLVGYVAFSLMDRSRTIGSSMRRHRYAIQDYTQYLNDPAGIRESARSSGKTPAEIRDWYKRRIEYHSNMLEKWKRASWINYPPTPPDPSGPPF